MKPRIGIFGLSGCWGEQIVMLNCEDELLALVGAVEFADFLGGSSINDEQGPLTIAFVEGSVGNAREEAALRRIRARAEWLVACGTCACFGGIAASEQDPSRYRAMAAAVYGPAAGGYDVRPHRPLHDFVPVDVCIPGCPMEKDEFLRVVASLLNGDRPEMVTTPVCAECRMREQECLLLSAHLPCAGPVTTGGCGARCPGFNVPCIGCRGPVEDANLASMTAILAAAGFTLGDIQRRLRTFAAPVMPAQNEESRR
jgi:coenzyme F420-reducing hydrogenase gamma subunit